MLPNLEIGYLQIQLVKLKINSYWVRVCPNPMSGVLIKRENRNKQTETQKEECHMQMRTVLDTQDNEHQAFPATTRSWEEARQDSPLELSVRVWPCWLSDFRFPASRTERQYISVILSHLVCGTLLWQLRKRKQMVCIDSCKTELLCSDTPSQVSLLSRPINLPQ